MEREKENKIGIIRQRGRRKEEQVREWEKAELGRACWVGEESLFEQGQRKYRRVVHTHSLPGCSHGSHPFHGPSACRPARTWRKFWHCKLQRSSWGGRWSELTSFFLQLVEPVDWYVQDAVVSYTLWAQSVSAWAVVLASVPGRRTWLPKTNSPNCQCEFQGRGCNQEWYQEWCLVGGAILDLDKCMERLEGDGKRRELAGERSMIFKACSLLECPQRGVVLICSAELRLIICVWLKVFSHLI